MEPSEETAAEALVDVPGDTSAQGPGQDEGVNTVDESGPAEEAEDVIGSYTAADADPAQDAAEEASPEAEATVAPEGQAEELADEGTPDAAADSTAPEDENSAPAGAEATASSRPASAALEALPDPPADASAAPDGANAAPTSRPVSATHSVAAGSSRPQSALSRGSRPTSALPSARSAAGSRPVSATPPADAGTDAEQQTTGSRPGSAVSAADASVAIPGSRPASAVAGQEQATSASAQGSRPVSAAAADAATAVSAPGSRPVSAVPSSRPTSALPPPAPSSRPTSSRPATTPADQPLSASRPPSGAAKTNPTSRPTSGTVPGQDIADAQALASARKAQAAEEAGYIVPGMRAIDVQVDQGPALPNTMIRVHLDYTQLDTKAYLGGFRNKRNGATYHHACTQTPKAPKYAGAEPKLERQTQTVKISTRTQQTVREASTQMERPGVILDTSHDVVKTPGRYQTSEERLAIVTAATRTIQRWVRGWIGRKRAAYLRSKKREREQFLHEQEAKAQQAAEEHRRKEIERRMHPRTAADFEILYNELEAWRLQETRKIKEAGLPADKEQEVLQQLLHKETKLLQTIDRLKINANYENKDMRIQKTLGDMSKPKQIELRNGKKVTVHTPFTTRAKELMQLYNGLNLPMLTIDERLDVLLHVKWTVKEFDCNLTREIVSLIDREADLLNRGRNPAMLEGLRKRISSMFLNFCETPEFNPEAARFQVVPMDFEQFLFQKLEKSTSPPKITVKPTGKWDL